METPPPPLLLTTTDISDRIAALRGHCNPTSVWRAIRRLKIQPTQTPGRGTVKLYAESVVDLIAAELRAPNKNNATEAASA